MDTVQEFASKIKTKYPQYTNEEDSVLINKIVAKYPQYKEQISFESINKPNPKANLIKDIIVGFANNPIGRTGFKVLNKLTGDNVQQSDYKPKYPIASKIAGLGGEIAASIPTTIIAPEAHISKLPKIAKLVTSAYQGAGAMLPTAGEKLIEGKTKEAVKDIGMGTAMGGAFSGLGQALSMLPKGLKSAGNRVQNVRTRILSKEGGADIDAKIANIGKYGLFGTPDVAEKKALIIINNAATKLKNKLKDAAPNPENDIDLENVFLSARQKALNDPKMTPVRASEINNEFDKLETQYRKVYTPEPVNAPEIKMPKQEKQYSLWNWVIKQGGMTKKSLNDWIGSKKGEVGHLQPILRNNGNTDITIAEKFASDFPDLAKRYGITDESGMLTDTDKLMEMISDQATAKKMILGGESYNIRPPEGATEFNFGENLIGQQEPKVLPKINLLDAQLLKQDIGKRHADFEHAAKMGNTPASLEAEIHNSLYLTLKEELENKGGVGVKELNKIMSDVIPLRLANYKRKLIEKRNSYLNLPELLLSGGGVIAGGYDALTGNKEGGAGKLAGGLAMAGAARGLRSPLIAKGLYNLGSKLENKFPSTLGEIYEPLINKTGQGIGNIKNRISNLGEETAFHGTSSKPFNEFFGDVVYLTKSKDEALTYAENPILGGGRGEGKSRILNTTLPKGKTKDINQDVYKVIMEEHPDYMDLDELIKAESVKARKEGYDYLKFEHPGESDKDFKTIVALYPKKIKIIKEAMKRRLSK